MKIKNIIRIVLMFFVFVPMFVMLMAFRISSRDYTIATFKEGLELTVRGESDSISYIMNAMDADLRLITTNRDFIKVIEEAEQGGIDDKHEQNVTRYLEYVASKEPAALDASILDLNGEIIYSSDNHRVGELTQIPKGVVLTGKSVVHIEYKSKSLRFMKKVYDGGKLIGFCEVRTKMADPNLSLRTQNLSNAKFYIFSDADSIFDYNNGERTLGDIEDEGFRDFLIGIYKGDMETYEYNASNMVAYASKIDGSSRWFIGAIDANAIYRDTSKVVGRTILFTLPMFITLSILSFIVAEIVVRPFNSLTEIMKNIRLGDKSARFDTSGGGEISKIGHEFNMLIDEVVRSEERHKVISGLSDSMLFDWNARTQKMYISENLANKFGISAVLAEESGILAFSECIHEDDFDEFYEDIQLAIQKERGIESEYRFLLAEGGYIWTSLKAMCITDWTGVPTHLIGVIHDIDAEKRKELELSESATYDYLTQLYNRDSFEKKLTEHLDKSLKRKHPLAIMFIDLDDFKNINDNYSHAAGDEVIKSVAEIIKTRTASDGFAGRFGGDEFVVCITSYELVNDVEALAVGLIKDLQKGLYSDSANTHIEVKCSIGIAISPEHGKTIPDLFMAADEAMYQVKKSGKDNYQIFNPDKKKDK